MPHLIKDEKRDAAYKQITNQLATIESINACLNGEGVQLSIKATSEKEKSVNLLLPVEEKDAAKVLAILTGVRQRMAKDIQSLADKYRIGLDDEDLACLNGGKKS